jgi:uncharacterized repeat protein (TIGR01451 family)
MGWGMGRARVRAQTRWRPEAEVLEMRHLLSTSSEGLTLTSSAISAGFQLTTFASGFPERSDGLGPFGVAFPSTGGVLVTDGPGNVRLFPSDTDGQKASDFPPVAGASYGTNHAEGLAKVGSTLYLTLGENNGLAQVKSDGTIDHSVPGNPFLTTIVNSDGITVDSLDGHLFVGEYDGSIFDVDPVAKTATVFANVNVDGMAFDPTTNRLYVALYSGAGGPDSQIEGFNVATKAVAFGPVAVTGHPDGIGIGTGALAGNLFANTNAGTLVEINLASKTPTVIASGGSRGDFVTVDPSNGSLLVSQSDQLARLIPPPGSGFGGTGASADLAVSNATAAPDPVTPGGQITYSVTVTNLGPDPALSVVGMVSVPDHTSFVSFSAPAGVTVTAPAPGTEGPSTITVTAPEALANQPEKFTLVVQVDAGTAAGTVVASSASVSSLTIDPNSMNNSTSASTTVASAAATTSPVTVTSFSAEKVLISSKRRAPKALVLAVGFSGALDMTAAQNLGAYTLFAGKIKKVHKVSQVLYNHLVPLTQAIYFPASNTVALVPRGKPKLPKLEQLHVNVTILTDPMHREVNNGKNFTATVTNTGLVVSTD